MKRIIIYINNTFVFMILYLYSIVLRYSRLNDLLPSLFWTNLSVQFKMLFVAHIKMIVSKNLGYYEKNALHELL